MNQLILALMVNSMELNVQEWKEFRIGKLFRIEPTKGKVSEELIHGNDVAYIGAKHDTNGLMMMCKREGFEDWISEGNCIVFIQIGEGSTGYVNYLEKDFIGMSGKTSCGYIDGIMNPYIGLFLEVVLCQERPKYSFGRSWTGTRLMNTLFRLPVQHNEDGSLVIDANKKYSDDGYVPDWEFMENYIKSLHSEPITTKINGKFIPDLDVDKWEEFRVSDIFDVKYGINMELNTCDETTSDDSDGVAFVARTAENNGVSAYVKRIDGKEPQPEGTITVAGGGSVLSTFIQKRPFYSGRDLYLLLPKTEISLNMKMFIVTVLYANQYRYSYGRQANKTLPYLLLKLPVQRDEKGNPIIDNFKKYSEKGYIPDWEFMENYIKSLPYSDRI